MTDDEETDLKAWIELTEKRLEILGNKIQAVESRLEMLTTVLRAIELSITRSQR